LEADALDRDRRMAAYPRRCQKDRRMRILGIEIGDGEGNENSAPAYEDDCILFNGVDKDGYSSFLVELRTKRLAPPSENWTDFCKTEWKPYDGVVTACLCYLSTATRIVGPDGNGVLGTEAFHVTSDGRGKDFAAGLDIARQALPHLAEILDFPLGVMADDLRTSPWIYTKCRDHYDILFCADGHGYVLNKKTGESAYFEDHAKLAAFLADHARVVFRKGHPDGGYGRIEVNIWEASGMFDKRRDRRIAKAQRTALSKLFPSDARHPPAFVRPEEFAHGGRTRHLFDLLPDRSRPDRGPLI
jgi:hypothetical protein